MLMKAKLPSKKILVVSAEEEPYVFQITYEKICM